MATVIDVVVLKYRKICPMKNRSLQPFVQAPLLLQLKSNRKLYVPMEWHHYQWLWVTLELTFAVWKFFDSYNSGDVVRYVSTRIGKRTVTCMTFWQWKTSPGHGHVHCTCGNISETVQDGVIVTTDHWQEVICGLSNSGNSDDLEWPSRSFTYCKPFQMWFLPGERYASTVLAQPRDSSFLTQKYRQNSKGVTPNGGTK